MRSASTIRQPALCVASIFLVALAAHPQQTPGNSADSVSFLIQAAKTYGLSVPAIKPWRLKIAFQLLDAQGNPTDRGSYEEMWVSPSRYKRAYSSTSFTQTQYGTDKGVLFTGNPGMVPQSSFWLHASFSSPIVSDVTLSRSLAGLNPSMTIELAPGDEPGLQCYGLRSSKQPAAWKPLASYCFDRAKNLATFTVGFPRMGDATFKNPVNFDGHLLPGDVLIKQNGVPVLSAHLESVRWLTPADEAEMQPPPDAVPWHPLNK